MDYMPYSDTNQQQTTQASPRRTQAIIKISVLIAIFLLSIGTFYWIAHRFPDKVEELIIKVDRFGITEAGAVEQARIREINRLRITYEEKQVLIQRTVFLNATRDMVSLALGDPMCKLQRAARGAEPATEYWVYYIEGDRKPTMLAFQNNELVNAGKASALDTCK
jgi:hypothetical protein